MSLKDIDLTRLGTDIPVGKDGGSFRVTGLSISAVECILSEGGLAEAEELFQKLKPAISGQGLGADSDLMWAVAKAAPGLVARVIAFAAGEPDQIEVVSKLPLPVQVSALVAIFEHTFQGTEELGNFIGTLSKATSGMTQALKLAKL